MPEKKVLSAKLMDDAWVDSPSPKEMSGDLYKDVNFMESKVVKKCIDCNSKFSIVLRKHHCRGEFTKNILLLPTLSS